MKEILLIPRILSVGSFTIDTVHRNLFNVKRTLHQQIIFKTGWWFQCWRQNSHFQTSQNSLARKYMKTFMFYCKAYCYQNQGIFHRIEWALCATFFPNWLFSTFYYNQYKIISPISKICLYRRKNTGSLAPPSSNRGPVHQPPSY